MLADGRSGAQAAWELGGCIASACSERSTRSIPARVWCSAAAAGRGQQATGFTWAGDQASDFWSLRALVVATLSAAASGFSNWSHDIGGYLGYRLIERCPAGTADPMAAVRLLHAADAGAFADAPGAVELRWSACSNAYRAYVLLHEQLVPYVRAAAATAARTGLPIIRPLCLTDPEDPRGWTINDAYGYGPALWVAPVLDDGAREREVALPRGEWIETWSGERVRGGGEVLVQAPLDRIPVWVRAGSIVVTYPAEHVAAGLGDVPERERPLQATLWGEPRLGRASARLADGTRVRWRRGAWAPADSRRELATRVIES